VTHRVVYAARALRYQGRTEGNAVMRTAVAIAVLALLAACGGDRTLHSADSGSGGPDEFSVVPVAPLQMPDTFDLPQPTPGGTNLTDPNPLGDGVMAFGGTPGAGVAGDGALMAQVARFGTDPAIRGTLATEDAEFRRRALGMSWNPFARDRYFPAYARFALDAYAELARFRAAGIATPSAPPQD